MQNEQGPECSECIWLALATVAGLHLPGFWLCLGPWLPLLLSFSLSRSLYFFLSMCQGSCSHLSPQPAHPPNPRPPPPALICVQKKCLLLERAGRTLSSHYQPLKGDYYVFCGWQRERERERFHCLTGCLMFRCCPDPITSPFHGAVNTNRSAPSESV